MGKKSSSVGGRFLREKILRPKDKPCIERKKGKEQHYVVQSFPNRPDKGDPRDLV